jgi:hypothetical protein
VLLFGGAARAEIYFSVKPDGDYPGRANIASYLDSPYGGIGSTDLARNPRLVGKHVDIGAYETDVLFANGFNP